MKKDKEEDLLQEIRDNFLLAEEYYSYQRAQAKEDFDFRAGDQWPEDIKRKRDAEGRPCFSINKLTQFIRQIVNNQKANRPQINVKAVDSYSDIETSKIFQSLIINIQEQSNAENSYDVAFDNTVTCGEGYIRIITDYADDMSFDQDIFIKPIDNPFSVYIDPNFKSDFSNLNWAFVFDNITKKEFERKYPDSELCTEGYDSVGLSEWISHNEIRIAEYFYVDYKTETLVQLDNGTDLFKKDYEKLKDKKSYEIIKERKVQKKIIRWVKTNGHEILEETIFPGSIIPVVPVFADTYIRDGKRVFEGVVRQAKTPQMAYNFWSTAEAEMIALAPKAPWVGAEGQFEGHEHKWNSANNVSYAYLEYKPKSVDGQPVGAPVRQQFDPQINSIISAKQASNEDLKAVTGIYDPSLGKEQKEASGVALLTKQKQAETTNFMYIDNLSKALKHLGNILIEIIPIVYDNKRVFRIIDDKNKNKDKTITLNSEEEDSVFLGVGKYDVSISIGPYGENQRQQAIESMLSLMQINPAIAQLIGDIFVRTQDWEGAQEISERLKIMLPPQLQENAELPPEIQAQIVQAQQEYEAQIAQGQEQLAALQQVVGNLTAKLNDVSATLKNNQAEIESKERIAALQARVELIKAGLKEDAADSRLAFTQELNYTQAKQQQGQVNIPQPEDKYILNGVNDPITQQVEGEQQELSEEEQARLLADLENYANGPEINPVNARTFEN